jgi:ABC-type transporter Mla maintaining outer membrane lipid asymmetry ATPase subunit MlaF
MNHELNELIENADIVIFLKSRRIAWLGHVMRMDEKRTPKRVLEWKLRGRRIRGRQGKDGLRMLKKIYRGWE